MAKLELVHSAPVLELSEVRATPVHESIGHMIAEGARVLDVGCGAGALIELVAHRRKARARGLEIDPAKVHACVRRGLAVVQGDAESDLDNFPSAAFDYVVFSHALLNLRDPERALKTAARIGERVIVSFDNAAHWPARMQLMWKGRLASWDGAKPCTIRDFAALASDLRLNVERATPLSGGRPGAPFAKRLWRANWFAEQAVFLLAP
jgi:methionine biosynthesis protein MetW